MSLPTAALSKSPSANAGRSACTYTLTIPETEIKSIGLPSLVYRHDKRLMAKGTPSEQMRVAAAHRQQADMTPSLEVQQADWRHQAVLASRLDRLHQTCSATGILIKC